MNGGVSNCSALTDYSVPHPQEESKGLKWNDVIWLVRFFCFRLFGGQEQHVFEDAERISRTEKSSDYDCSLHIECQRGVCVEIDNRIL